MHDVWLSIAGFYMKFATHFNEIISVGKTQAASVSVCSFSRMDQTVQYNGVKHTTLKIRVVKVIFRFQATEIRSGTLDN